MCYFQHMADVKLRIQHIVQAAVALAESSEMVFSADDRTDAACRHYLKTAITASALEEKVAVELGDRMWRPLGKLLLIVSENDVLGTAQSLMGAYLTGNRVLVKARTSFEILHFLKKKLQLGDDFVQIADWEGGTQDDAHLLSDVDGVVLAGGGELITHFRRVAPPHIRLIEFGPKISAVAIGQVDAAEIPNVTELLLNEVGLFLQQVCSSPRFILVEDKKNAHALFENLTQRLKDLPQLSEATCLAQASRFAELQMMKRFQCEQALSGLQDAGFEPKNGWGVSLSYELKPSYWFEKGFQIVAGSITQHIKQADRQWKGTLQTLGMMGCDGLPLDTFTRFCPLGKMHCRPLTVPHDGFYEFGAFVSFISMEK